MDNVSRTKYSPSWLYIGLVTTAALVILLIIGVVAFKGFHNTQLIYSAENGDLAAVETDIAHGADPNITDEGDVTPLMIAVINGNRDIVVFLLRHGAKTDAQDVQGHTALMSASDSGDLLTVTALVHYGAKTNIKDKDGLTALDTARKRQHEDIVRFLQTNRNPQ